MKVIICGAGQVGYGIAERLSAEGNDVSVIDISGELVQRVNDNLEARGILGHGSHPEVLATAGAGDADMIIAVTLHDEINMVACQIAHSLFNIPTKIARVRAQSYLDPQWSHMFARENMAIDVTISPELEVGEVVLRRLNLPGAFETMSFADGQVAGVGVRCEEGCPIVDTPLKQLSELFPDLPVAIVAIVREGRIFVPHRDDQLLVGDDAFFVAPHDQVGRTLKIFGHDEQQSRRVVIAGGGNIGLYVAREIEKRYPHIQTRVIDFNRQRAAEIAAMLPRTVVLHGSSLSESLLREADITRTDTIVAVTNDDQVNILTCVLARQLGCLRNLCLINSPSYSTVVRSLGIGAQVNPRTITISRILQHVRRGRIRGVFSISNGQAELIEAEAFETAPIVGRPLRELRLKEGVRFGAILRDGKIITPTGSTELQAKDRAIVFATSEHVRDVERMFSVSLEYF